MGRIRRAGLFGADDTSTGYGVPGPRDGPVNQVPWSMRSAIVGRSRTKSMAPPGSVNMPCAGPVHVWPSGRSAPGTPLPRSPNGCRRCRRRRRSQWSHAHSVRACAPRSVRAPRSARLTRQRCDHEGILPRSRSVARRKCQRRRHRARSGDEAGEASGVGLAGHDRHCVGDLGDRGVQVATGDRRGDVASEGLGRRIRPRESMLRTACAHVDGLCARVGRNDDISSRSEAFSPVTRGLRRHGSSPHHKVAA